MRTVKQIGVALSKEPTLAQILVEITDLQTI
jgi:hypothetical protein